MMSYLKAVGKMKTLLDIAEVGLLKLTLCTLLFYFLSCSYVVSNLCESKRLRFRQFFSTLGSL